MTPDKAKQLSRLVLMQRLRALHLPGLVAVLVAGVFGFISLNLTLSVEQSSCNFVRWTQSQAYSGRRYNVVFCDLADGRTIMARAGQSWTPPALGTKIPLQIERLVFGTNYRVLGTGL